MNDWTQETAEGYEAMLETEEKFLQRKREEFSRLETGAKVLYFNHAFRRDEWATIEKVVPTTAHIGYVVSDKGKQIWASELKLVHSEAETETLQVCLNDRLDEFQSAVKRAANSTLQVFADWDKDHFVVVNRDSQTEYRVALQTRNNRIFASCGCPDFKRRSRICKHISETLKECFAPMFAELEAVLETESEREAFEYMHELV
jgi:hypothetical protein